MLYYDGIDVFEGIDINKISASKGCDIITIGHYFLATKMLRKLDLYVYFSRK